MVVGGGSGGHVTPVIAVANELKKQSPHAVLEFWTDKKYYSNSKDAVVASGLEMRVRKLSAGKLRRYTNFGFLDYLAHFKDLLRNFLDLFRVLAGMWQSFCRFLASRPNVVFLKGGFVCLPVGIVAHWMRIPYVIHDSDAAPGLTNRILAKHATKIATGMPLEFYNYPKGRAVWTGIPISADFVRISKEDQEKAKVGLGFDAKRPLVVVTGGSLGAAHINEAILQIHDDIVKEADLVLVSGKVNYDDLRERAPKEREHFRLLDFTNELAKYYAAADVVVARAGASTLAELASMAKVVVLVPNHKLPGFHQVKNAECYEKAEAALLVRDAETGVDGEELKAAIYKLLEDKALREKLSRNLAKTAKNNAAKELADIVLKVRK